MPLIEDAILRSFVYFKRARLHEEDIFGYVSYRIPELARFLGRGGMDQVSALILRYMYLRPDLYRPYTRQNGRVLQWKYVGGVVDYRCGAGDCFILLDADQPQQVLSGIIVTVRRKRRCCRRIPHELMMKRISAASNSDEKNNRLAGKKRHRDNIEENVETELKRLRVESSRSEDLLDYEDYENR